MPLLTSAGSAWHDAQPSLQATTGPPLCASASMAAMTCPRSRHPCAVLRVAKRHAEAPQGWQQTNHDGLVL